MNMRALRISLRQLMAVVGVIAFAIVSLKYASPIWQSLIGLVCILALIAAGISGIFDRGQRQAFAIGFALVLVCYWGLIFSAEAIDDLSGGNVRHNREFDVRTGQFPTTLMLRPMYERIVRYRTVYRATGRDLSEEEAAKLQAAWMANPNPGPPPVSNPEFPQPRDFAVVGHCWWALFLSCFGGLMAGYAYWKAKEREQQDGEGF
jgi:hypothetical protein